MSKREEYIAELKAMHNHIGLCFDSELGRLIGFHEDESDYYFVVSVTNGRGRKNNEVFYSMVGAFESLKDKMERYDQIENTFTLNGAPPTPEFRVTTEIKGQIGYINLFTREGDIETRVREHFLAHHGRVLYPNDIAELFKITVDEASEICQRLVEKGQADVADFGEGWDLSKQV